MILPMSLLTLPTLITSRLVVDLAMLDTLTSDDIMREAVLLGQTKRNSSTCPGVQENVNTYEFFVTSETGEEVRETAELVQEDITITQKYIQNKKETWIGDTVKFRPDLNCMGQDDERLIKIMQEEYLRPPSTEEYNRTMIPAGVPNNYSQFMQEMFLDKYVFKGMRNGYFLEAGAVDFVTDSNTLWFELEHSWSGVLVEANPTVYPKGLLAHRKAWAAPFCLSTEQRPLYALFNIVTIEGGMAGIVPNSDFNDLENYELQCFPLYSLLLALDQPTVNLLSLDIEGAEFKILETLPFDKVDIEVLLIELAHAGKVFPGTRHEIHNFLSEKGFRYIGTVVIDDIFVREDLLENKYKLEHSIEQMEAEFDNFYFNDDPDFITASVLDDSENIFDDENTEPSSKDEL